MQSQVEIKTILNIPANSNILSVGTFMFVRGVGGLTEKDASMLNSVLDKLSVDGCKVLGSILMSYARQTKEVIAFNRDNEKSNVINLESRKFATSNPSYSSYILTTTMRSMSLLTALSYEKSSRGGNNLVFSYKDGVTTINIENENVNVKDAPKKVEQTLRNMGEKVVVKSESRLEKYANANMSSEYVTEFLGTEDKSIEGVPLVEQGMMIRTGIFEGKYGVSKAAPKNMSNAVSAHLVSDGKELKAFFTTKSGINKTGTSLPNSHVFFKDGIDVDGVGIKKGLAQSIIKENDMDINCGQKEAEAAFRIYLDDKNPDTSRKLLYNPSWAAKDLADAKKNSGGLDSFTAKYRNVLNKIPVYTGAKGLKYILIPHTSSLSVSLFTKLPNVVEKLIAYYVMSASVVRVGGFKSFVDSFFRFNVKEAMRKLVMISLQYLFNDYDIVVELQGIKKTAQDIWAELDGDNKGMVDNVILDEVDMDWNLDGALTFDKKEEYYNPYKYMDDVGQRHKISIAPSAKGGQHYNDSKINIEIDDDEEINSEISEFQLKARKDAESDMQKYEGFYVYDVLGEDMINSRYSRTGWDELFLRKLCVNVFGKKWVVDNAVVYLDPLSVVSKYSEVMEFNEIVVGFVKGCETWKVNGSKSKLWCEKVSDLYISYFNDVNWGD